MSRTRAPGSITSSRWPTHRAAAYGLAVAPLRRSAALLTSILLFVLASWLCGLAPGHDDADHLPCLAGPRGGAAHSAIADVAACQLPAGARRGGDVPLVHDALVAAAGAGDGGWITDNYSWPWIFYINIPVGLAAATAVWIIYSRAKAKCGECRSTACLVLLVLWIAALQRCSTWARSTTVRFRLRRGTGCGRGDRTSPVPDLGVRPRIPWSISPVRRAKLLGRTLALSGATGSTSATGDAAAVAAAIHGVTATDAGMILAPVGISRSCLSPLVGETATGSRHFVTFAFVLYAGSCARFARSSPRRGLLHAGASHLLQGIAMPFFSCPCRPCCCPACRRPHGRGLRPEQFPAHQCRRVRHVGRHHFVGEPAPRGTTARIIESVHAAAGHAGRVDSLAAAGRHANSRSRKSTAGEPSAFTLAANDLFSRRRCCSAC